MSSITEFSRANEECFIQEPETRKKIQYIDRQIYRINKEFLFICDNSAHQKIANLFDSVADFIWIFLHLIVYPVFWEGMVVKTNQGEMIKKTPNGSYTNESREKKSNHDTVESAETISRYGESNNVIATIRGAVSVGGLGRGLSLSNRQDLAIPIEVLYFTVPIGLLLDNSFSHKNK